MNFYEELGVSSDASSESIRDAYRNLARLLHPDGQIDPVLKDCAESQMKRINHLYGVLSDIEKRRRYDLELADHRERPAPIIVQAPPPATPFQHNYNGTLVWLTATAICAIGVIWLASRETPSAAVYPPRPQEIPTGVMTPKPAVSKAHDDEIVRLRAELAAVYMEKDRLQKQLAAVPVPAEPIATKLSPEPMPTPAPLLSVDPPVLVPSMSTLPPLAPPQKTWSGSWIYTAPHVASKSQAVFPPEFIEAKLTEDNGRLQGRYRARFKVPNPNISPDVDFAFEGKLSGTTARLQWTAAGGAKGEVRLHLLSPNALEVNWNATNLGTSMGLASGTAVLTRKN